MPPLYGQSQIDSIKAIAADITLESTSSMPWEDGDSNDLTVKSVHGKLIQTNILRGITRKYSIVNSYYLLIFEETMFSKREYWVHLGYLRNNIKRRLLIAWKWLIATGASGLIAIVAYKLPPAGNLPYQSYAVAGILFACTVLTAISLFSFIYQSRYCHVYYSRTGDMPFVELIPGRPDRKDYREFRDLLQTHMYHARRNVMPEKALAMELREHRRLNELGVINNRQYHCAKARIFKGHTHSN
jgi:hypothetical protein